MVNALNVTKFENRLVKFKSTKNGYVVDILDNVITEINSYTQLNHEDNESGGVLLGYKLKDRNYIVVDGISHPNSGDVQDRLLFIRKSKSHMYKIFKAMEKNSFCIGNWHTHPFDTPNPSVTDMETWMKELKNCKSSCGYQFYIIAANNGFKVWMGNEKTKEISQLVECGSSNGVYMEGVDE